MSAFNMLANSFSRLNAKGIVAKAVKTSLSGALFPDIVYLQRLTDTADPDAGDDESFDKPGTPLACSITATKVIHESFAADQEVGVTPVLIAFADDPGAVKGDRLIWIGRVIRLKGPARPEAGAGSLYLAQGEIRD